MRAIGITRSLPVEAPDCFIEFESEKPKPTGRDILVRIEAISVNPVDFKMRQSSPTEGAYSEPRILGWDAVGIVEEVGDRARLFSKGDAVFYAGDITRPGSNQESQLVDERIVGRAPQNLTVDQTAVMPLTSLTAWEILFDRIRISPEKDKGKSILIIGGAGGVGSIAIQIAKKVAGLTVLATASRPESAAWCRKMGADFVVDHRNLVQEVKQAGFETVDFIVDFVDTLAYWDIMAELIATQGHIASITGSPEPIALNKLKTKSASFSWELMYTRSMFKTDDMICQHRILNRVAELLDNGTLVTTLKHTIEGFSAEGLREAHRQLESGSTIGKIAITM